MLAVVLFIGSTGLCTVNQLGVVLINAHLPSDISTLTLGNAFPPNTHTFLVLNNK